MPRSEKSLGYLCQKFVMLFLESPVSDFKFAFCSNLSNLLGMHGLC